MMQSFFIVYVKNQDKSMQFYQEVFGFAPSMHAPGMTEFTLPDDSRFGLMPEEGIKSLLGEALPDPAQGSGIPRAEIYLTVNNPMDYHTRALKNGAVELQPLSPMPWGQNAAYSMDPDGHVIVFAEA